MATRTPWGPADYKDQITRGIIFYGTPGHGGYHLSKGLNAQVPDWMKAGRDERNGWYEEDCAWCIVPVCFPQHFATEELGLARESLKHWYPDAYERYTGAELAPGESHKKDQRLFAEAHAQDFVVIACHPVSEWPKYHLKVYATKGGQRQTLEETRRNGKVEGRWFSVPPAEYRQRGQFGFVIDLARHQELRP